MSSRASFQTMKLSAQTWNPSTRKMIIVSLILTISSFVVLPMIHFSHNWIQSRIDAFAKNFEKSPLMEGTCMISNEENYKVLYKPSKHILKNAFVLVCDFRSPEEIAENEAKKVVQQEQNPDETTPQLGPKPFGMYSIPEKVFELALPWEFRVELKDDAANHLLQSDDIIEPFRKDIPFKLSVNQFKKIKILRLNPNKNPIYKGSKTETTRL